MTPIVQITCKITTPDGKEHAVVLNQVEDRFYVQVDDYVNGPGSSQMVHGFADALGIFQMQVTKLGLKTDLFD